MSRIGKQPIQLNSTTTRVVDNQIEVTGSKGTLFVSLIKGVSVSDVEGVLQVTAENVEARAAQGLVRTLLNNAVVGVTSGWKKDLELHGVGMRAAITGTSLTLSLGFSHPVIFEAPTGISFQVTKNVISVFGIDKQLVGETAAQIRKLRQPEPYKGKGIRYSTESVRRKAGKTGKAGK